MMLLTQFLFQTQAKIKIDNANPVYSIEPYTNQYGECGTMAKYIHFTPDYLLNDTVIQLYGPRGEWCLFSFNMYSHILI